MVFGGISACTGCGVGGRAGEVSTTVEGAAGSGVGGVIGLGLVLLPGFCGSI